MSEELNKCRQCGGQGGGNDYDASITCGDCGYEEACFLEWEADRCVTKADVEAYCRDKDLLLIPKAVSRALHYEIVDTAFPKAGDAFGHGHYAGMIAAGEIIRLAAEKAEKA